MARAAKARADRDRTLRRYAQFCAFYGWTLPEVRALTVRQFSVFASYMDDAMAAGRT